jgi:hypothetical protein
MPVDSVLYSANWGFANRFSTDSFRHQGKYTEKIGGYLGFFPTHCPIGATGGIPLHEFPAGILQCYSDNTVNYKADDLPCGYLPSPTKIEEPVVSKIDITVSPNPATGYVYIKGNDLRKIKEITIYDLTGRKIETITSRENSCEINLGQYVQGVYIIRFGGNGFSFAQKLIVTSR